MTEIIETSDDGRYRLRLEPDTDAHNPRTMYDHLTHVITLPDSDYADVDKDGGGPLADTWRQINHRDNAVEIFCRWARIAHGAVVIEDQTNDGPGTIWYLMPEGLAEVTDPTECIRSEIAEYRAWARGEAYGYIIEKAVTWKPVTDENEDVVVGERTTWEEVTDGSCWGLITYEWAEREARDQFTAHLEDIR
ncbi:hypothetical protein ACFVYG_32390 [Streptomyces sp. NPDC058256]|uniref:hypothetical protein n=1 Tax=Streptomyces sp. NPDC058256 TaxID=3346408 RepID=UPI0036E76A0D